MTRETGTVPPSSRRPSPPRPERPGSPTHISLSALSCGLPKDSIILLEQIRTLDKRRLREHMGKLDDAVMKKVDNAIAVSFGLHPETMV